MPNNFLDSLDQHLVRLLAGDGRAPVRDLAQELDVAPPTIRSRIKRLVDKGVLRIAGLLDPGRIRDVTVAIVALNLVQQEDLEAKLSELEKLDQVQWAAVVSGRYDILVEVAVSGAMPELYDFLSSELPRLGGIRSSETFVFMKTKRKWIMPPSGDAR